MANSQLYHSIKYDGPLSHDVPKRDFIIMIPVQSRFDVLCVKVTVSLSLMIQVGEIFTSLLKA